MRADPLRVLFAAVVSAALLFACGGEKIRDPTEGEIDFQSQRPTLPSATETVPPYTGTEPLVIEASNRYVTGLDLHRKLIMRSCGPLGGVCHNTKEYPDLHTPANLVQAINAPCNVQPGSHLSVYDRCERLGDRFQISDSDFPEIEVGWIDQVPGDYPEYQGDQRAQPDSPGLHVHLQAPLPGSRTEIYGSGVFIREFTDDVGNIRSLPFVTFQSRWWVMADRKHLVADVPTYRSEAAESLMKGGIIQGDANRNGIFGFRTGKFVTMINPGRPEESYLVARLRGHMQGETIPGTRMPLANQPPSIPDMVALMCFIEGLDAAKGYVLENPINYADCSYVTDPGALNLVGKGVTFSGKIKPLLQANCGGCHGGQNVQGNFDVLADGLFERLLLASKQQPGRKLVAPGQPEQSYLWLKLAGDGSITGSRMPIDPLGGGVRPLSAEDLAAMETWITAGALND